MAVKRNKRYQERGRSVISFAIVHGFEGVTKLSVALACYLFLVYIISQFLGYV